MPLKDTDFLHSSARIKVIEKDLLSKEQLSRMLEAQNAKDAFKVLSESGYGTPNTEYNYTDYDKMLFDQKKKVYDFIKNISPTFELFKLFSAQYDYHNLKAIIKGQAINKDIEYLIADFGSVSTEKLTICVRDNSYSSMSSIMSTAVLAAQDVLQRTNDPQLCDIILDKACFSEMHSVAEKLGSNYVVKYVAIQADLLNISTMLRCKRFLKDSHYYKRTILPGGLLNEKRLIEIYELEGNIYIDSLKQTPYIEVVVGSLNAEKLDNKVFEKLSDNYLMQYIKKARYIPFGVEILVAYILACEAEIRNVQIIMAGKLANMSIPAISERLREVYV